MAHFDIRALIEVYRIPGCHLITVGSASGLIPNRIHWRPNNFWLLCASNSAKNRRTARRSGERPGRIRVRLTSKWTLQHQRGEARQELTTAVEVPYFLSKYNPDPLRFYLRRRLSWLLGSSVRILGHCLADIRKTG
jgi:hypothetical protein